MNFMDADNGKLITIILIGSSTGGPGHIDKIVKGLSHGFKGALIIAQHMSPHFIESFTRQIGAISPMSVFGAHDGMRVEPSSIYVCSGECRLLQKGETIVFAQNDTRDTIYTPDIDTLFFSASTLSPVVKRMGVILTGIGDDGAKGSLALFNAGGRCMFESEESAIVFGMPRRAKEVVPQAEVGNIAQIVDAINRFGAK